MPISTPQYISVDDADAYFATRLNSDDWLNASLSEKTASLIEATRAINRLSYVGVKCDTAQANEFPRYTDYRLVVDCRTLDTPPAPPVPDEILIACCEEAIVRLGGIDMEMEIEGTSMQDAAFAGVKATYTSTSVRPNIQNGIASYVAWTYLQIWLSDTAEINLSRVS